MLQRLGVGSKIQGFKALGRTAPSVELLRAVKASWLTLLGLGGRGPGEKKTDNTGSSTGPSGVQSWHFQGCLGIVQGTPVPTKRCS